MNTTYSVITLDGQEHKDIDFETIKLWYVQKKLNDDSLIYSAVTTEWKLLKKIIDTSEWKRELHQLRSQMSLPDSSMLPTAQSFPNSPRRAAHANFKKEPYKGFLTEKDINNPQLGLRTVGVFLLVDLILTFLAFLLLKYYDLFDLLSFNKLIGFSVILVLDIILIAFLFKSKAVRLMRIITLSFSAVKLLVVIILLFGTTSAIFSVWSGMASGLLSFICIIPLLCTQKTDSLKVLIGSLIKTGAVFLLIYFNSSLLPTVAQISQFKKSLQKEPTFTTEKTNLKISLPDDWKLAPKNNSLIKVENSSMIAVNLKSSSFAVLQIEPPPATYIQQPSLNEGQLSALADETVQKMAIGFKIRSSASLLIAEGITENKFIARKIVFERREKTTGINFVTHLIFFRRDGFTHILQLWCSESDYQENVDDFEKLENTLQFIK
jgi:hypothetical protein